MNTILLSTTSILSFLGFAIAFYGTLAQKMIDNITRIGMSNEIDAYSENGAEYYTKRYNKWKAGNFFVSKNALIFGLIIVGIAITLNLIENSWWSSFIVLTVGSLLYLIIVKIIGWKIQLLSFIFAIFSLTFSIYLLIN